MLVTCLFLEDGSVTKLVLNIMAKVYRNDENAAVGRGTDYNCLHLFYCGRRLGRKAIPGSDGKCGPNNGPQCDSCKRFQKYGPQGVAFKAEMNKFRAQLKVCIEGARRFANLQ